MCVCAVTARTQASASAKCLRNGFKFPNSLGKEVDEGCGICFAVSGGLHLGETPVLIHMGGQFDLILSDRDSTQGCCLCPLVIWKLNFSFVDCISRFGESFGNERQAER